MIVQNIDSSTLEAFLDRIEKQYGKFRRTWLMDRGIPTEDMLEKMRSRGIDYLVGTPKEHLTHVEKPLLEQSWIQARESVRRESKETLVKELPGFSKYLLEYIGNGGDSHLEKCLPMRNTIVHAGRISDEMCKELLDAHIPQFEKVIGESAFFTQYTMVGIGKTGEAERLSGVPGPAGFATYNLNIPCDPNRVFLIHNADNEALDIFPLSAYGEIFLWDDKEIKPQGKVSPMLYFRKGNKQYIEYTTFVEKPNHSQAAGAPFKQFQEIFQVEEWRRLAVAEDTLKTFTFYYEKILDRLGIADVESVITPLICTLARAHEPLTFVQLKEVMCPFINHLPDWETLIQETLDHGHIMLKRQSSSTGGLGYTLYHESFRKHLETSDRVKRFMGGANTSLVKFCLRWKDFKENEDCLHYALRYAIRHLITVGEWDNLGKTLTDLEFIEAKCAAGMTYVLADDYKNALDGHPDAQKEKETGQKRAEELKRYTDAIIAYARKWSEARALHASDQKNNPLDRIKVFSQFVNAGAHNFVKYA